MRGVQSEERLPGLPPPPPAYHPERPARLEAIVCHLLGTGVYQRCVPVPCREATDDELLLVHEANVLEVVKDKEGVPDGQVRPRTLTLSRPNAHTLTRIHKRILVLAVCALWFGHVRKSSHALGCPLVLRWTAGGDVSCCQSGRALWCGHHPTARPPR